MSNVEPDRVNILHALAKCVETRLVVQDIEAVSGKLTEGQLAELQTFKLCSQKPWAGQHFMSPFIGRH